MSHGREEREQIFQGNDFGDKLTFTVGVSYCMGFLTGILRSFSSQGQNDQIRKVLGNNKKLRINNYLNNLGSMTTRYGNACAAAGLLYCLNGGGLNLLFEDELDQFQPITKNSICGFVTGFLYKLPRGLKPGMLGGAIGCGIIASMTLIVEAGNKHGIIPYEMSF